MLAKDSCPICNTPAKSSATNGDYSRLECPRCGSYEITPSVEASGFPDDFRAVASGWIYDQNQLGSTPKISSYKIEMIRSIVPPSFFERVNKLLVSAVKRQKRHGEEFNAQADCFVAATYSHDASELTYLIEFLRDKKYLKGTTYLSTKITGAGYMAAEELLRSKGSGAQAFVAMWFDDSMATVYERAFVPAIKNAGYEPIRIDNVEHNKKICDEIVAQIRRSRFVVADCTGHRGGVYFEAGFAMGLSLPVFFTCRTIDLDKLHFDIRQFNTIEWNEVEGLASRLEKRIVAVIGDGPMKPPLHS